MGGATVLLALQEKQNIKFVVEDCSYSSFKEELKCIIKKNHLPSFIFSPAIRLLIKWVYHWDINSASPIEVVKKTETPILFIHGDQDTFVPRQNVYELFDNCHSYKKLWVCLNAKHA